MATITVATLASQLAKEFDVTEDQYAARDYFVLVEKWIDTAYKEILNTRGWSWRYVTSSFPSVNLQTEYKLNTSVIDLRALALGPPDNVPLQYTTVRDIEMRGYNLTQTGIPQMVYETGYDSVTQQRKVSLFPVPNSASFTIVYHGYLTGQALTPGSVIPFPEAVMPVLEHRVRYFMFKDDGDNENAAASLNDFKEALKAAKTQDAMKTADESNREYVDVPPAAQSFPILLPGYPRF